MLNNLCSNQFDTFAIPSIWITDCSSINRKVEISPIKFFQDKIDYIIDYKQRNTANDNKHFSGKPTIIYNLFVRYATAFDHNDDGKIVNSNNEFRETGTFLKAISLLPYIKSLGADYIYLLPITSVGQFGKKGNLGSPYSIANPYKLDDNLSEPLLNLTIEEQFAAFVQAAHSLDMKVIIEFVFRTSSLDSELAIKNPEWFYWLEMTEEEFRPPQFTEDVLHKIGEKIDAQDFNDLPTPDAEYINKFADTPTKVYFDNGQIIGITTDGKRVTLPKAFADWPPDDKQPLWTDVTYLKLYTHHKFNYIAYNTIRMYDNELCQNKYENKELWEFIAEIIPYYMQKFGIDGVMLDMGHALPGKLRKEIVERARKINPNFIFWEENFLITEKSKYEGYDAVVGYLPFDFHVDWKIKQVINSFAHNLFPIDFFLTAETHNTKRASARQGSIEFSKIVWAISRFLPGLPFLHNGFELGEKIPVNTGLGFKINELSEFPPNSLPLFSSTSLDWINEDNIIEFIKNINNIFLNSLDSGDNDNIELIDLSCEDCIGFKRRNIMIIANISEFDKKISINWSFPSNNVQILYPIISGIEVIDEKVDIEILAFQVIIIKIQ